MIKIIKIMIVDIKNTPNGKEVGLYVKYSKNDIVKETIINTSQIKTILGGLA